MFRAAFKDVLGRDLEFRELKDLRLKEAIGAIVLVGEWKDAGAMLV